MTLLDTISNTIKKKANQVETGLSSAGENLINFISDQVKTAKYNLGIQENTPNLRQGSTLYNFGTGLNSLNQKLLSTPIVNTPYKYGTMAGEQIGSGIKQIQSGQPSNFLGAKIPAAVAAPTKIGLGLANLTPAGVVGNYAMDIAETAAAPVFGKDSLATTGIGLAAGIAAPGGFEGDVSKAEDFISKGKKILEKLPKEERLKFLLKYPEKLQELGYTLDDLKRISSPVAAHILEAGISPTEYRALKTVSKAPAAENILTKAKNAFNEWVNSRAATQVEGFIKRQDFAELDNMGLEGIFKFQSGSREGKLAEVQNYFDSKYQELKNAGIKFGYKGDYLPQLWANTKEEIETIMGRRLTQRPSFSFKSIIKDYETGMSLGLTPRFNNISELAQWYEQTANKALADRKWFDFLLREKFILPSSKALPGWVTLDPDRFPSPGTGKYKAPAELATAINNYLQETTGLVKNFANLNSTLKNLILTSGLPNTAVNFHAFNLLSRNVLANSNPIKGFLEGVNYMLRPGEAQKFLNSNLDDLSFAIHSGMTASSEEHALGNALRESVDQNLLQKLTEGVKGFHNKFFDEPLFGKMVPALKLKYFNNIYDDLSKVMTKEQAAKEAATATNNIFGGQNLDVLLRNKQSQDVFRSLVLAPDWVESNLKVGKSVIQALTNPKDPVGSAYRVFARNYVLSYMLLNVANKTISGHWAVENDPGHQFELESGYTSAGQKRYVRPYGTSADFIRLPFDFLSGLLQGDISVAFRIIRNRLSPMAGQVVGQLSNTNFAGQPIANRDSGIGQQLLARGGEAAGTFAPSYVANPVRFLTGSGNIQSPEQLLTQTLELPVRYAGGAYNNLQKVITDKMQATGASGADIYNVNQSLKGQALPQNYQKPKQSIIQKLFGGKEQPEEVTGIFKYTNAEAEADLNAKTIKSIVSGAKSQTEAEKQLQAAGVWKNNWEETIIPVVKTLNLEDRAAYLQEVFSTTDNYKELVDAYADAGLMTSTLINLWIDDGTLTEEEGKYLKNYLKYKKTGKVPEGKKVNFPSITVPKIQTPATPKLNIPQMNFEPLKVEVPK